ncbi:MAG: Spy/CpxP family protein refolding chaperone [Alphaproteobacteria bacterium]
MSILKPALCAAALVAAAAIAIPAIAQQPPPSATQPAPGPQAGPEGRGDWRGGPRDRYSDEDAPRWRRGEGRRYGRDDRDEDGPRGWHHRRFGERDGMMGERHGRGMRGFGMMGRVCGPDGGRMGEMMINRLERVTQPTAEQRANFDKLKEAAGKAHDIMRGVCPIERSATPTGRLANAEKRLAAMLEAVRTVRPAMDAYYGTLSDEQKARLAMAQHMGRPGMGGGWRERMQQWRDRAPYQPQSDRTENIQQDDESERL